MGTLMTAPVDSNPVQSPKLTVCIATYNRGKFIGQTLASIIPQLVSDVELVVVDGASTDDTQSVMHHYVSRHPQIRYVRQTVNSGVDCDYDKAVGYARGDYCWLMSDDDLLKPMAIQRILKVVRKSLDLVVVNSEIWNADYSFRLRDRRLAIDADLQFSHAHREAFFVATANQLGFIGCVIIRREFWLSREREKYYGSLFIHVGVIFQTPGIQSATVIAEPMVAIRDGNASWAARTFEVWAVKWPGLIWSFPDYSDAAKQQVCRREPWRSIKFLLYHRAMGSYSLSAFRRYLRGAASGPAKALAWAAALIPGQLANALVVLYYVLFRRSARLELFDVLCSVHAGALSRVLAGSLAVSSKQPR
jgi:abequosyltransferase